MSASSSATARSLPIALALCLTACATNSPTLPPPPIVRCEQGKTAPVEPPPADWLTDGPVWALGVLGLLEQERELRGVEHRCLESLRKSGAIR